MKRMFSFLLAFGVLAAEALGADLSLSSESDGSVRIEVAGGVSDGSRALVLCWGALAGGADVASWEHQFVVAEIVPAAGGSYTASPSELNLQHGNVMRAFLVDAVRLADYVRPAAANVRLDTEVAAKSGVRTVFDMDWYNAVPSDGALMAAKDSAGNNLYPLMSYPGKWYYAYGESIPTSVTPVENQRYVVETKLYDGLQSLTVDGVEISSAANTGAFDLGMNLPLFCRWNVNKGAEKFVTATLYSLRMYENGNPNTNPDGTLARDFLPCIVGDAGALYDTVSRDVFFPVTGSLTYGAYTNALVKTDSVNASSGSAVWNDPNLAPVAQVAVSAAGTTATFAATIERLGAGSDSVKVTLAYGADASSMTNGCVLAAAATTGDYEWPLTGLKPGCGYCAAVSFAGAMATTTVENLWFATEPEASDDPVMIFGARDESGVQMLFRPGAELTAKLYLVWDFVDQGDDPDAWAHQRYLGEFDADTPVVTIPWPAEWGDEAFALRVLKRIDNRYIPDAAFVETVSSSGAQWIDTGYVGAQNATFGFKFSFLNTTACHLCGAYTSNVDVDRYHVLQNSSGKFTIGLNNSYNSGSAIQANQVYEGTAVFSSASQVLTANGAEVAKTAVTTAPKNTKNLYLFARNAKGTADGKGSFALSYFTITEGDQPVRDFRPAVSNGVACLYDRVEGKFYFNAGSGAPLTASGSETPIGLPGDVTFSSPALTIPAVPKPATLGAVLASVGGGRFSVSGSLAARGTGLAKVYLAYGAARETMSRRRLLASFDFDSADEWAFSGVVKAPVSCRKTEEIWYQLSVVNAFDEETVKTEGEALSLAIDPATVDAVNGMMIIIR